MQSSFSETDAEPNNPQSSRKGKVSGKKEACSKKISNGVDFENVAQRVNGNELPISEEEASSLKPTSICGHLQLIFALLQFSPRK